MAALLLRRGEVKLCRVRGKVLIIIDSPGIPQSPGEGIHLSRGTRNSRARFDNRSNALRLKLIIPIIPSFSQLRYSRKILLAEDARCPVLKHGNGSGARKLGGFGVRCASAQRGRKRKNCGLRSDSDLRSAAGCGAIRQTIEVRRKESPAEGPVPGGQD